MGCLRIGDFLDSLLIGNTRFRESCFSVYDFHSKLVIFVLSVRSWKTRDAGFDCFLFATSAKWVEENTHWVTQIHTFTNSLQCVTVCLQCVTLCYRNNELYFERNGTSINMQTHAGLQFCTANTLQHAAPHCTNWCNTNKHTDKCSLL